jgi:hypothetical protein
LDRFLKWLSMWKYLNIHFRALRALKGVGEQSYSQQNQWIYLSCVFPQIFFISSDKIIFCTFPTGFSM